MIGFYNINKKPLHSQWCNNLCFFSVSFPFTNDNKLKPQCVSIFIKVSDCATTKIPKGKAPPPYKEVYSKGLKALSFSARRLWQMKNAEAGRS